MRERSTKGSDQQLRERVQLASAAIFHDLLEGSRLVGRGWVRAEPWRDQVARAQFGVFDGLGSFDAAIASELWLRSLESVGSETPPVPIAGA